MNEYEKYERNGSTVTIFYDESPESPREWDNAGTMICSHKRYDLGDEQFDADDYEGWDDLKQHLIDERGAVIILPLGLYDHSGITMYVGDSHDRWDGGQVGFIFIDQAGIDKDWNGDKERAEKCLRAEVEDYDHYLTGEVYGYQVESDHGEDIDSCWGFYDLDQLKQEANDAADSYQRPHDAKYAQKASQVHA